MKKRLLSLLLCALMVTGLLPGTAFAEVAIDPVTYGVVWAERDKATDSYVDSTDNDVRTELRRTKGDNDRLQFAGMQKNGTMTILAPTNVTFTPDEGTAPTAVTVEDETNVAVGTMPVYRVGLEDFGSGKLIVTLENGSFEVPVTVELPEYGFYTAPTPSEAAFVSGDFTFNGTNSLYLLPYGENVTITNPGFENSSHAALFDLTAAGAGWQISLKQDAVLNDEERITVRFNQNGENYQDERIWVSDTRGLAMAWSRNGQPSTNTFKTREITKGSGDILFILYNGAVVTDLNDLVYEKTKLKITSQDNIPGFYNIEPLDWGTYTISYKNDPSAVLTYRCVLPEYGFYTTTQPGTETYVEEFTFTGNNHLYLLKRADTDAITDVKFRDDKGTEMDSHPLFELAPNAEDIWELTIKEGAVLGRNERARVRVYYGTNNDYNLSIGISDASGLTMGGARWNNGTYTPNNNRFKSDELSKGDFTTRFFFYQNELVTDLSLLSWSENLELSRSDDGSGAFEIRLNNWENGTITYKADRSAAVTIKAALPSFGFYSTPSAAIDTYLDKLVLTSMDATKVYALFAEPEDPADISSYELEWRHNMAVKVSQTIKANNKILGYELTLSDFTGTDNVEFGVRYTNGSRWGINLSVETNIPGFDPENPFKGEGDVEGDIYEDILVYRQVDEDGEPVGEPLRQLGMGNALPDRTFYVFAKGDVTFTENSLLIPEADEDLTTTRCVADDGTVYFQVVSVANAYLWRRIDFELYDSEGDRDPAWIHVNTAMPGEHQVRITYQGKEYIVGNVTDWNADLVQLGSGNLYFWSTGERLPVFDLDVGAVTEEIDPINGLIEYKPAPEINALLKIVNSGLYSYVGGELCAVDETNTDVYQVTQVGLQYTAQTKETIQDCTYYNIVTFTVGEDPTEYSFIHRHHMDATRKIVLDLTDEATRAVYDSNSNNNIDLNELHAILDKVDAENWDTATIKLPQNNWMRGLLIIDTKTVIVLEGNGSRLDGSIRVDTLPYLPHAIIRMECYSTIRGVANPADVGVYGQGGADVKYCGFNGYHVGVKSYDISEDYYNENAHNPHAGSMKMVRNCRFAENYIGIWIEEGGANGWSTDSFGDSQFYHNGIAVWVENLEERWEVAHLIIFEECLFIDNGWDLVNRSQYRLTHWHCYFGRWPQTAGQPPIVDYTYAMTVEETADGTEDGELDPDGLAKLAAVDPEDVTILAPVVEGDSISAPQVGSFELENGRLEINEEDLLVAGENASVNNENDAAFDVGAFDGKLDVQQPNGAQYDNIATWDFSKEDDK